MRVMSIIMFIIASLNCFVFGGSAGISIILLLLGVAGIAISFYAKKFIPQKFIGLVYGLIIVAFVALAIICPAKSTEKGINHYETMVGDVINKVKKGDSEVALDVIDKAIKEYGETDEMLIYRSSLLYANNKPEEALTEIKKVSSLRNELYYQTYANASYMNQDYEAYADYLMKGAKANPDSYLLNAAAGAICADSRNYYGATYFLTRALELKPSSALAAYTLAGVNYYGENYDRAYELMKLAYEGGINENTDYASDELFVWYMSKAKEGK